MTFDAGWYTSSLSVAFALLFICTFFTLLGTRRKLAARDAMLNQTLQLLATRNDLNELAGARLLTPVEDGLGKLRDSLKKISYNQQKLQTVLTTVAVDHAVTMAADGRSPEDIAEHSPLGLAEAKLLVQLHAANTSLKESG
ncbi:MAG: hypothetical protein AAGA84_12130 [Pseudomonadota bacterium]